MGMQGDVVLASPSTGTCIEEGWKGRRKDDLARPVDGATATTERFRHSVRNTVRYRRALRGLEHRANVT